MGRDKAKNKNARDYLQGARELEHDIGSLHEQIRRLQAMAARATRSYEALRSSGTPHHSKVEDAITELDEVGRSLSEKMQAYNAAYCEISATIEAVKDSKCRELLSLRYLEHKKWEEIAFRMNYSWRSVHYLHAKALTKVCTLLHIQS